MNESVVTRYQGFVLVVTDRDVTVLCRRGRQRLATVPSVKQARLFVRGWRRGERQEASLNNCERRRPLTLVGNAAGAEEVQA